MKHIFWKLYYWKDTTIPTGSASYNCFGNADYLLVDNIVEYTRIIPFVNLWWKLK